MLGQACKGQTGRETSMDGVVETIAGRVRGARSGACWVFKGVPCGADTSGLQRFKPPTPPAPWSGVRDATACGPTAPQVNHAEMAGAGNAPSAAPDTVQRVADFMAFLHGMSGDEP